MEQFSLEKWLQDKSRKVVTRDGRNVRIICWDIKSNTPIIAAIQWNDEREDCYFYNTIGRCANDVAEIDLFFADEEEVLTEFEKQLGVYIYFSKLSCEFNKEEKKYIRNAANTLINLARKELEANYYTKVIDDRMVFKSELHEQSLQTAYDMGKQDALKDLPKWKKITEEKQNYLAYGYLSHDGYYLSIQELKDKLPKEE